MAAAAVDCICPSKPTTNHQSSFLKSIRHYCRHKLVVEAPLSDSNSVSFSCWQLKLHHGQIFRAPHIDLGSHYLYIGTKNIFLSLSTHERVPQNKVYAIQSCYHAPPPTARQWGFCVLGQFIVSLVGRSTSCGVESGEVHGLANVGSVVPSRREPMLQVLATVIWTDRALVALGRERRSIAGEL